MSLSSTVNRVDYAGNGVTTSFAYTFRIFSKTDLKVTKRNTTTNVETPLTVDVDYTVSGVGVSAGGTITLTLALPATHKLTILRQLPITQLTDIRNQSAYYPEALEDQFDRNVMIMQQHYESISRSLRLTDSVKAADFDMKVPADIVGAVGKVLIVNNGGLGWALGPTATEISNAQGYSQSAFSSASAAAVSANNAATSELNASTSKTDAAASATASAASAAASAASAASAAGSVAQIQLAAEQTFSLANNQATPADVTGFAFASNTLKYAFVQVFVQRITTGAGATEAIEGFVFMAIYAPTSGWRMFPLNSGDNGTDCGVTFSVTSAGQVQYISSSITGTPSVSKVNWRVQSLVG